jgi:NADH pyrophosphatase NudC (nudix superfamily)
LEHLFKGEHGSCIYVPFYQYQPLLLLSSSSSSLLLPNNNNGNNNSITNGKRGTMRVLWQQKDAISEYIIENKTTVILLGKDESSEKYCFAFNVLSQDMSQQLLDSIRRQLPPGDNCIEFVNLREAALLLPSEDAAILAQAKALLEWNHNQMYCGTCGSPTVSKNGGLKRVCTNINTNTNANNAQESRECCAKSFYPRTDPVVIMLVIYRDQCLLGRQKKWPPGIWSCLAGFIDSGESIEEAVKREVKEEAGVDVSIENVYYFSSQPWPFLGGQLMIGCYAYANSDFISVDREEIEEAQWYSVEQVKQGLNNSMKWKSDEFRLPPSLAIAHKLCKAWVENQHVGAKL